MNFLCKFSLESSTCVVKTQDTMGRRGPVTLLFAKFVPGLSTMAPPIAGQAKIPYLTFLLYDGLGTCYGRRRGCWQEGSSVTSRRRAHGSMPDWGILLCC